MLQRDTDRMRELPVHPASQYDMRKRPVNACMMKAPVRECEVG
jgi:hypothetical protein